METKFTKGNWNVAPHIGGNYCDIEYDGTHICYMGTFTERQKADALLISKSPELLETLQQCVNLIKFTDTDFFSWPDRIIAKELIQRAEQLIMDATNI